MRFAKSTTHERFSRVTGYCLKTPCCTETLKTSCWSLPSGAKKFGKNHNTPGSQYSIAGPYDQWPSGMGFQYFYGFMGGETDQWTPYLFRDHTQVFPWIGKPGYNLITDIADDAINYMNQLNSASPEQPFFIYYVPGGSHSPHNPKRNGSTNSTVNSTRAGTRCASRFLQTRKGWESFLRMHN